MPIPRKISHLRSKTEPQLHAGRLTEIGIRPRCVVQMEISPVPISTTTSPGRKQRIEQTRGAIGNGLPPFWNLLSGYRRQRGSASVTAANQLIQQFIVSLKVSSEPYPHVVLEAKSEALQLCIPIKPLLGRIPRALLVNSVLSLTFTFPLTIPKWSCN